MSLEGHSTCPHCRALVQSTICTICGKSAFEEVAPPPPPPERKLGDAFENNELRKLGIGLLAVLGIAAGVVFILTRSDSPPTATALPPPSETMPPEREPESTDAAPSVRGGVKPTSGFVPGAPREVGEGLAPWETPPPIDFVSGLLLDETIDYSLDIVRTAEVLAAFPAAFTLAPLDPPEILTFDGSVDAEQLETTQPFAARTILGPDDTAVGEVWLIASAGTEAGDAYLAAARARWDVASAIEQYAPEVGVRLWLLGADDETNLWAGDLSTDAMVLLQVPVGVDPAVLTDAFRAWRRAG